MASCNDMKYFCLGKVLSICGKKIKKNHYKQIRKLFKRESQPISDTNACAQVRDRLDQEIKIFHLEDRLFSFRLRIKKKNNNHTGNYDNNNTDNDNLSIKIPKIAFLQVRKTIQVNVLIK